jgi:hypothetical protein
MVNNLLFPKQFEAQFAEPIAKYVSFDTYVEMQAFIVDAETAPLAYSGQLATCKDREGIVYILNEAEDEWLSNTTFDYITFKTDSITIPNVYDSIQGGFYAGIYNDGIKDLFIIYTSEGAEQGDYSQALAAFPKSVGGFTDWILPTKEQLKIVLDTIGSNEGWEGYAFWSSDEVDETNAYSYTIGDLSFTSTLKTESLPFIAIRLMDGFQLKNTNTLEIISTGLSAVITEDSLAPGIITLTLDTEVKTEDLHDKVHSVTDSLNHSSIETDPYKVLVPKVRIATISDPDPNILYADGIEWKHIELIDTAQSLNQLLDSYPDRFHAGQKFIHEGTQYILNADKTKWVKSDFQKITIGDFKELSDDANKVVTLASADDRAFYAAHGTCTVNNKFYIGERQVPTSIVVFHDPNDLSNYTKVVVPTTEIDINGAVVPNWIEAMCYDSIAHRIYATMFYIGNTSLHSTFPYAAKIIAINPSDISDYTTVFQSDITDFGDSPCINTDGTYVYVGAYSYGHVYKIRISDWTIVQQITISNMQGLHSSQIYTYSDRTELYITGKVITGDMQGGIFAKIDCSDLSYTTLTLTGILNPTDDFAFIYKDDDGGTAYISGERDTWLCVVNTETMTFNLYPSIYAFFVGTDENYVYVGGNSIVRHEISNPNNITTQTLGGEVANELFVSTTNNLYYTCWRNQIAGDFQYDRSLVHFKFYDGNNGFVIKNNEPLLFKGEDGITIDYLTPKTVTIKGTNTAKLQKFTAVTAQTTYTVTSFNLNSECLVFVNNALQDVTVSGQNIILGFEPDGGEIIKVLNVTT